MENKIKEDQKIIAETETAGGIGEEVEVNEEEIELVKDGVLNENND